MKWIPTPPHPAFHPSQYPDVRAASPRAWLHMRTFNFEYDTEPRIKNGGPGYKRVSSVRRRTKTPSEVLGCSWFIQVEAASGHVVLPKRQLQGGYL